MSDDDIITEPNITASEEQMKALENLKKCLENPDFLNYSEILEQDADKEGIKIAAIDPTDFEQEDQNLEKERIMALTQQAKDQHDFQLNLLSKEQKARNKLHKQYKKQNKKYQILKENSAHAHQLRQVEVSKIWRQKELDVRTALQKKKAEIQVDIVKNDIKDEENQLVMGGISRIYKVTWRGRPQVVEIRIDQCRDIKDKLEKGTYMFRVSTKDKIGGKILQYQHLSDEWCNISDPIHHEGKHSSRVLRFEANLKVLVPSKLQILPTMVYCFQILDSNSVIVAEGYFPIIDNLFEISQGKFKVPLVRSSIRTAIDKFSGIEQLYRKNIDEWLCNLYFHVTLLPQVIRGETDYKVELKGNEVSEDPIDTEAEQIKYGTVNSPQEYSEFKHCVAKSGVLITPKNKLEYIYSEIITEFGFKFYRHWATYFTFILLILMIWLSRYLHFAGQWLYLKAESFPVSDFKVILFTAELRYESQTKLRHEALILIIGTLFILFWFLCMCLWAFLSLLLIGRFPHVCFRIIMTWGIVMVFDPIITIVEAIIYGVVYDYWEVDPFRLYNYFERAEGNGVVGALLTIFLYAGLIGFCFFIFYNYFLFLHMNGRLLDIYMRLNGNEDRFFIPHDGEVSKRYLEWVCYKAKNYHTMNGDSRKISVFNYQMFDGFNTSVSKTAIHVLIYTISKDRSRELYRHFLRLPDGAITELSPTEHSSRKTFTHKYSLAPSLKSRGMTLRGYD